MRMSSCIPLGPQPATVRISDFVHDIFVEIRDISDHSLGRLYASAKLV